MANDEKPELRNDAEADLWRAAYVTAMKFPPRGFLEAGTPLTAAEHADLAVSLFRERAERGADCRAAAVEGKNRYEFHVDGAVFRLATTEPLTPEQTRHLDEVFGALKAAIERGPG